MAAEFSPSRWLLLLLVVGTRVVAAENSDPAPTGVADEQPLIEGKHSDPTRAGPVEPDGGAEGQLIPTPKGEVASGSLHHLLSTPHLTYASTIGDTLNTPATQKAFATGIMCYCILQGGGPTWQAALAAGERYASQLGLPKPRVAGKVGPAAEVVTEVVNQEDITVPSNVMYVRFSKPFLEKYFCRTLNEQAPVSDTILGATVVGTRHTVAATELTLVENPDRALAKLLFAGRNTFRTASYKDRVRIDSQGTTRFRSETTLQFDGKYVRHTPVVTWADTETTTTGISTDLPGVRRRIVLRVASREAADTHARSEAITTERTKQRVAKGFESRVGVGLAALTEELQTQYAKLPFEGRFALREIRASTTAHALELVVIGRGEKEPTFVNAPPVLNGNPDIEFHLHTALIQKAILNADLRATLQSAVLSLVDRPLMMVVSATRESLQTPKQSERNLKLHWSEGEGLEWLSLGWNSNDKTDAPVKTEPRERVSVRMRP
jgi:hypothetical protein